MSDLIDHRSTVQTAFAVAVTDGTLAQALADHFDVDGLPEISVEAHRSFQQALWQVSLTWPGDDRALPTRLAVKAHPGRFSVWDFKARDLGAAERMGAHAAQAAGVKVPTAFNLSLGGYLFWVLEWMAGHKPSSAQDFELIGKSLAALHGERSSVAGLPVFSLHEFLDHLHHHLSLAGEEKAAAIAMALKDRMADVASVLTHGDPHQGNWLINEDAEAVLLDFEDAALFPPARDLAVLERAAGAEAFASVRSGYQAAGGEVPSDLRAWHALLALQDFALAAHIKSHLVAGQELPPMDAENWLGLSRSSVDQIAAMLEE